jgi:hypothetical protein
MDYRYGTAAWRTSRTQSPPLAIVGPAIAIIALCPAAKAAHADPSIRIDPGLGSGAVRKLWATG